MTAQDGTYSTLAYMRQRELLLLRSVSGLLLKWREIVKTAQRSSVLAERYFGIPVSSPSHGVPSASVAPHGCTTHGTTRFADDADQTSPPQPNRSVIVEKVHPNGPKTVLATPLCSSTPAPTLQEWVPSIAWVHTLQDRHALSQRASVDPKLRQQQSRSLYAGDVLDETLLGQVVECIHTAFGGMNVLLATMQSEEMCSTPTDCLNSHTSLLSGFAELYEEDHARRMDEVATLHGSMLKRMGYMVTEVLHELTGMRRGLRDSVELCAMHKQQIQRLSTARCVSPTYQGALSLSQSNEGRLPTPRTTPKMNQSYGSSICNNQNNEYPSQYQYNSPQQQQHVQRQAPYGCTDTNQNSRSPCAYVNDHKMDPWLPFASPSPTSTSRDAFSHTARHQQDAHIVPIQPPQQEDPQNMETPFLHSARPRPFASPFSTSRAAAAPPGVTSTSPLQKHIPTGAILTIGAWNTLAEEEEEDLVLGSHFSSSVTGSHGSRSVCPSPSPHSVACVHLPPSKSPTQSGKRGKKAHQTAPTHVTPRGEDTWAGEARRETERAEKALEGTVSAPVLPRRGEHSPPPVHAKTRRLALVRSSVREVRWNGGQAPIIAQQRSARGSARRRGGGF